MINELQKRTNQAEMKRFFQHFFVVLTTVALAGATLGQQLAGRPDRGTGGQATQASTEIDNVNLQNGNVSLQIPLASLPPVAGGKLSYTLTAYYNSSLWNSYQNEGRGETLTGCDALYSSATVGRADNGGWKIGGQYQIVFRDAKEDYNYLDPDNSECYGTEYATMQGQFFKPVLRMPDGSEHEMRIAVANFPTYIGFREHLYNYYKSQGTGGVPFSAGTRMYTVDGTYITAIYEPNGNYTIFLKDGTKVQPVSGGGQRITDPNGNSILLMPGSAKDEYTGREIKWSSTVYNGQNATKVEYQSAGGAWQSVWVVWGTTDVHGLLYETTAWDPNRLPNGHTCTEHGLLQDGQLDVVKEIILPSTEPGVERKYTFEYNSDTVASVSTSNVVFHCIGSPFPTTYTREVTGMGEISSITTPSGAEIKYHFAHDAAASSGFGVLYDSDGLARNPITKKEVIHDGTTDVTTYEVAASSLIESASLTNPDGSTYSEQFYPTDPLRSRITGTNGLGGLTYRSVQSGRVMTERHWTLLGGSNLFGYGSGAGNRVTFNPVVDIEYTSLLDDNGNRILMTAKKFDFDYNGELKKTTEYDWFSPGSVQFSSDGFALPTGIPTGAEVLRVTENSYYNGAAEETDATAYHRRDLTTAPVILGKPKQTTVGTLTTPKSIVQFSYDGQTYGTAPTIGNLTNVSAWDDSVAGGRSVDAVTTYTSRGNVETTTDGNGNVTRLYYEAINGFTDLYPTKTVAAFGTTVARTSSASYDFYTGLVTTATDVDNQVPTATEYDILGRPTKVSTAAYSALESRVLTEYSDSNKRTVVRSDLDTLGDGKKVAIQHFDQLGRVRLSRTLENAATQDPYNEAHGIKVETQYAYKDSTPSVTDDPQNNLGTYVLTSNPYRAATAAQATNEETMGWTLSYSTNNGRHSEVTTFAHEGLPAAFGGGNTDSTGAVTTDTYADQTLVTDQADKKRMSRTNAIGQLKDVWEITAPDQWTTAVSFGSPAVNLNGYETSYSYDSLSNLTGVNQGTQQQPRSFTYSSLSRLTSATNSESGTIQYQYDPNGNLTKKTDARGVVTDYIYDELNRVKNRNYSTPGGAPANYQATPNVTYTYGTAAPAVGKLTKVDNGFSSTEYLAFDVLGRVTRSKQTTDGVEYGGGTDPTRWMTYTYNLAGALIEQQYPSGRVVKNVLDASGDLSIVQSRKNSNSGYWSYADSFTYNPAGAVTSMQLGNGRWESTIFNSRLQPTQIALGTVKNGTDKLKLEYGYGSNQNNGNVMSQVITVPAETRNGTPYGAFTATQAYTYDYLNRLESAEETIPSQTGWKQTFKYDRYGNRTFDTSTSDSTTTIESTCPIAVCNPQIDVAHNRLIGLSFDAAGNTKTDAEGRVFTYDGENKQTKVVNGSLKVGEYFFDGDGKRIKKIAYDQNGVETETTVFVYDASGKLVAEYSTLVASPQDAKVSYLTNDHLGTPRINTDANGAVTSRHDYRPFGEEIGRASYGGDAVTMQFTGYKRDNEVRLDFAKSRFLSPLLARFYSPDKYSLRLMEQGGELSTFSLQPQNWNAYTYCRNNPLKYVDLTGEHPVLAVLGAMAVRAIVGAAAGAAVGAAIEAGRQIYNDGEITNPDAIKGAAADGAIYGAFVGAAGPLGYYIGAPIRTAILAGAIGSGTGGVVRRNIEGQPTTTGDVITDTLAGSTGAAVGSAIGRFTAPKYLYPNGLNSNLQRRISDEAIYRTVNSTANKLFVPRGVTNYFFDSQMGLRWLTDGNSVPAMLGRAGAKKAAKKTSEWVDCGTTTVKDDKGNNHVMTCRMKED